MIADTGYTGLSSEGAFPFLLRVNGTERFRATTAGRFGFNTNNPEYGVDIRDTSVGSGASLQVRSATGASDFRLVTEGNFESRFTFVTNNVNRWQIGTGSAGDFFWYNFLTNKVQVRFRVGGITVLNEGGENVGIGNLSPNSLLQVGSSARTAGIVAIITILVIFALIAFS
jgi:hypothetical protein